MVALMVAVVVLMVVVVVVWWYGLNFIIIIIIKSFMIVIIMRKSTCKGSLCECKPVSWSQLLGNDHLVHHTHSKYCDALVMVVVTIMKMTGETTQEVRSNKLKESLKE